MPRYCDQTHILMVILSNFYAKNNSNILTLSSICDEIENYPYIQKSELKKFITNFYEYDNDNSLLIIGKEAEDFKEKQWDLTEVEDYNRIEIDNILNYIDKPDKNNYKVNISDAILSCVEYVYIHYEFYNYCSNQSKHNKNVIPLFATIDKDKKDNICLPKLFARQIEDVFKFTQVKLKNMKDYFCDTICSNKKCDKNIRNCDKKAVADYKKSKIVYNNTFHATRVINNHINYIDAFREFLLKYNFDNIDNNTLFDFHKKTQTYLIDYIKKYVDLFYDCSHDSIIDDFHINIFRQITKNIQEARGKIEEYIENKEKFVKIRYANNG
jgi:hypothetical protein